MSQLPHFITLVFFSAWPWVNWGSYPLSALLFSCQVVCLTLCNPMDCSLPGSPVLHYLPEFAQIHVCWVSDAIQPSLPLSPLLPGVFPSIKLFFSELALRIRWPKYWSFSISPSNEYSGLISFRIDWIDLLTVQGTLRSCLQHHSLKASILWCSAFFMVQLSYLYVTTGKNIALTRQSFAGSDVSAFEYSV